MTIFAFSKEPEKKNTITKHQKYAESQMVACALLATAEDLYNRKVKVSSTVCGFVSTHHSSVFHHAQAIQYQMLVLCLC